jgi:hypothetical protein
MFLVPSRSDRGLLDDMPPEIHPLAELVHVALQPAEPLF